MSYPRHLAPTVGRGAPSSGDLLWTGTLFLPGEQSQPSTADDVSPDALCGTEIACAASCLADLVGEIDLSDELSSDAGISFPESCLVSLLDQLHVASVPAVDLESVGSTDPMIVDSDTASLDAFPTNMVVYDGCLLASTVAGALSRRYASSTVSSTRTGVLKIPSRPPYATSRCPFPRTRMLRCWIPFLCQGLIK